MTLADVRRLHKHWEKFPPLRVLVAACGAALGVKLPSAEDAPAPMTAQEAQRLYEMTGGKVPGVAGV